MSAPRWTAPVALALLGAALGLLNVTANHGLVPWSPYLSTLVGNGWAWLATGFAACWGGRTWSAAALRGLAFYLPAALTYDALDLPLTRRSEPTVEVFLGSYVVESVAWLVICALTAAALALLVAGVRRGGAVGFAAALVVPVVIAWSGYRRHQHATAPPPDEVVAQVSAAVTGAALGITLAVTGLGLRRLWRDRRPDPELRTWDY